MTPEETAALAAAGLKSPSPSEATASFHTYEGFQFPQTTSVTEVGVAMAGWGEPDRILSRPALRRDLKRSVAALRQCMQDIERFADENASASQASQWLSDNFYIVERVEAALGGQLEAKRLQRLPGFQNASGEERARIELFCRFYLQSCDFDFDADELIGALEDYQRTHPLTIRELWLLAPMLNLVLLRQLAQCAQQIIDLYMAVRLADTVADAVLKDRESPTGGVGKWWRRTQHTADFQRAYRGQLAQRSRYHDPSATQIEAEPATAHADDESRTGAVASIEADLLSRAMLDVQVRNIFLSIKAIDLADWLEIFSATSRVDRTLNENASYARLDADSKTLYRREIERLSVRSKVDEPAVARLVVDRSASHDAPPLEQAQVETDIGWWLLSDGREAVVQALGVSGGLSGGELSRARLAQSPSKGRVAVYVGSILLLSVLITAFAYTEAAIPGHSNGWWAALLLLVLGWWPASELAQTLVNLSAASVHQPAQLPRYDFRKGIPEHCKTMVVIPTLLNHAAQVEAQVAELERHYLSNRDDQLRFALLTDWRDAPQAEMPEDKATVSAAREAVARLNERYPLVNLKGDSAQDRFYLFHRVRRFNPREGVWMGWERKRGKLDEFNRLLLGAVDTSFQIDAVEQMRVPRDVRFVMTLDADTRMPIGGAARLVGTASHPLNRAVVDPATRRVVRGFGLFQPQISALLAPAGERSIFRWIISSGDGVDPYASAASDIYQDVFGEATFTGKGLYDLHVFDTVMAGRVPENSLLSHDLFETAFARCALVGDVSFFEDFPSHSEVAAARSHRWVRGDWQLLPWLLGLRREPITALNRWKMLDNLRRSMLPIATLLLIIVGLADAGTDLRVWMTLVLVSVSLPGVVGWLGAVLSRAPRGSRTNRPRQLLLDLGHVVGNAGLQLVLLGQNAYVMGDAIARALWRTFVSKRHMLEWRTAAQVKASAGGRLEHFSFAITSATVSIIVGAAVVLAFNRYAIVPAAPLLLLWWLSPVLAVVISSPVLLARFHRQPAGDVELAAFRTVARRTWTFFETYVGEADHHLPPDNVQFDPEEVVAHRTSPTNIGLYLLSVVAARDAGWITSHDCLRRIRATLDSVHKLERFNGHLLNWVDTSTLTSLEPRYVSFVDSGNLAGHLIVLAQACRDFPQQPLLSPRTVQSLADSAIDMQQRWKTLLSQARAPGPDPRGNVSADEIERAFSDLKLSLERGADGLAALVQLLHDALAHAAHLHELLKAFAEEDSAPEVHDLAEDSERVERELTAHLADVRSACPWVRPDVMALLRRPEHASLAVGLDEPADRAASHVRVFMRNQALIQGLEAALATPEPNPAQVQALRDALALCRLAQQRHQALLDEAVRCGEQAESLWRGMDFRFLFDARRKLFSIGYRVNDHHLDDAHYDLLASEARLGSYVASAKGDVQVEHWFRLGRHLGLGRAGPVLTSWSGSMFEYLMPAIVMSTPRGSLMRQTCVNAIEEQIAYGRSHSVPWGISESAINVRDLELTYQYGPSGVPQLSLKRGMDRQLVVAPYATALAAPFVPEEAHANFAALKQLGGYGRYGFFEAIDFTADRLEEGRTHAVIQSHMAHHQAMSLLSLCSIADGGRQQQRFHTEPEMSAFDLLLQERPLGAVIITREQAAARERNERVARFASPKVRRVPPMETHPSAHLMSNGRYAVVTTSTGSGYSKCGNVDLTRWREDRVVDESGLFIYLRDVQSDAMWSATTAPTFVTPQWASAEFSEARAQFDQAYRGIRTSLEVVVAQQEDAEIRTLTLINESSGKRTLDVCALTEVVLAPRNADIAHPTFSNLFVTTEFDAARQALVAVRRARSATEPALSAVLGLVGGRGFESPLEYDSDRRSAIGRGRSKRNPRAMSGVTPLAGTTGAVLDPVMCLRQRITLAPGATVTLSFVMTFGNDRDSALRSYQRLSSGPAVQREVSRAWVYAQAKLHQLGVSSEEAATFQTLAGHLLFSDAAFRPGSDYMKGNRLPARALWRYGISGDRPIVLLSIESEEDLPLVDQLTRAHRFWRARLFAADIVILNDRGVSYSDDLQHHIDGLIRQSGVLRDANPGEGGMYVLRGDRLPEDERRLLLTLARVLLGGGQGFIGDQIRRHVKRGALPRSASAVAQPEASTRPLAVERRAGRELLFFNGVGGFTADGSEYRFVLPPGKRTPAPWVNVIASPAMGTVVSESGASFTWRGNSRENQITPWSNDPLCDPSSEMVFIQDKASGAYWTPSGAARRLPDATYEAAHGAGYSRFSTLVEGIDCEWTQFVAWDQPKKYLRLRLTNSSGRRRTLGVTAYAELCLGDVRSGKTQLLSTWAKTPGPTLSAALAKSRGDVPVVTTLYARNAGNADFGAHVAWMSCSHKASGWTCDRTEFLGLGGGLETPQALEMAQPLRKRSGIGPDPAWVLSVDVSIDDGATEEVIFVIGQADSESEADTLSPVSRSECDTAFKAMRAQWERLLTAVHISTPDGATDLLMNRWMLYQTISSRILGRCGFYQAGGAYGFRDQLQDVMALVHVWPEYVRGHLLRAAAQQFVEGDVQHWWHPQSG
ncbi:MAG: phosphorylase, partial [Rhizobacter sp.]|nr:phosphorylase [Rhizobacter sp.]